MVTCVCRDLGNSGRLECRRCAGGRLELPEPGTGTWHCRAWAGAAATGLSRAQLSPGGFVLVPEGSWSGTTAKGATRFGGCPGAPCSSLR